MVLLMQFRFIDKKAISAFLIGVVATLIGLIVISIFAFNSSQSGCGKCSRASYEISSFNTALTLYALDNANYPADINDLSKSLTGDLLDTFFRDPWGNAYHYARYQTDEYTCFAIWSFGSDGKPGGKQEHEQDIYYYHSAPGNCIKK
jgi:hypothetical protein